MQRSFTEILDTFTAAVAAGNGAQFSALFTEDGVYDDVFYGEYHGREAIAQMLEGRFTGMAKIHLAHVQSGRQWCNRLCPLAVQL